MPNTKLREKAKASPAKSDHSDPNPTVAHISQSDALRAFATSCVAWNGAGVRLVAAGAVALIVGAYSPRNRVEYSATMEKLRKVVDERGVKQAQAYKYLGLSRELCMHLAAKYPIGGPVADVLAATDATQASEVLVSWLANQGIKSLDGIGLLVGRYQRSEPTTVQAHERGTPTRRGRATASAASPQGVSVTASILPTEPVTGDEAEELCQLLIAGVEKLGETDHVERLMKACRARLKELERPHRRATNRARAAKARAEEARQNRASMN
jgi:hypothetical protein